MPELADKKQAKRRKITAPHTDRLIDGARLRGDLAALAADHAGNETALRAAVLAHLKDVLASGRRRVEAWLMDDGKGRLCAERLSHLEDEIMRALYDFATAFL